MRFWTRPAASLSGLLAGGAAWVLAGTAATMAGGLVSNVILARLLQPDAVGTFFLTFSVVTVAAVFGRLGLDVAVVRLVSEADTEGRPSRAAGAIRRVLCVGALASAAVGALLSLFATRWLAGSLFRSESMKSLALVSGVWAAAEALRLVVSEVHRGFHDYPRAASYGHAARSVLAAMLLGVLVLRPTARSLSVAVGLATLASVLSLLLAAATMRALLRRLGPPDPVSSRLVLPVALPLTVMALAALGLAQADLWVVGSIAPPAAVALYASTLRVVALLGVPLVVANAVLAPVIVRLRRAERRPDLEAVLRATATAATVPMLVALSAMAVGGRSILELMYGEFYGQASSVLLVLALGQLFNVAFGSCGMSLIMTGNERMVMWVTLGAALVTVVSEVVVGSRAGILGVAACSAAGVALQNLALLLLARQHLGVWTSAYVSPRRVARGLRHLRGVSI